MSNPNQNRGNYYERSGSNYSNRNNSGSNVISGTRRPDGSYREEIRVRPGFVPEAERAVYVPPAARSRQENASVESDDDRVNSWADESAPIISEICSKSAEVSETTTKVEVVVNESKPEEPEGSQDISEKDDSQVNGDEESSSKIARKPSELATAIDKALDNLSLNGTEPSTTRPIGRFATQIANDEREGRKFYRRYEKNNQESVSSGNSGFRSEGYNRSYNRSGIRENPSQDMNRIEGEYKTFMEALIPIRKEMAVINVKLEYIRYMKARDVEDLTDVERERIELEEALVERLGVLFEAVDGLSSQ